MIEIYHECLHGNKVEIKIRAADTDEILKATKLIRKAILDSQPHCSKCENYYQEGYFCGYKACSCKIYGCLELPSNPHHDCDASKCKDYVEVKNE